MALTGWLTALFPGKRVLAQLPIEAAPEERHSSVPEPDLAVLAEQALAQHKTRLVLGDEILLAIEVADTSLRQDLVRKRDLYARAGVTEYWVADIPARRIVVHRAPANGQWGEVFALTGADLIAPPTQPGQAIAVESLF